MIRHARSLLWMAAWRCKQARLSKRGWYDPGARSSSKAIFIGGCPRSGTTLLREILGRHSSLVAGLETAMLVPGFDVGRIAERYGLPRHELSKRQQSCQTLVEFADSFYAGLCAATGKPRWIDKAPANVRVIGRLLSWFPYGRFIHVIRDGRDVVCSLRHYPREILKKGRSLPHTTERPIEWCAETWVAETSLGLAYRGHPRCFELRYEELIARPEAVVRGLCDWLGEAFEPGLLIPDPDALESSPPARFLNNSAAAGEIVTTSVGRWRRELSPAEQAEVVHHAGELLRLLGYDEDL